MASSSTIKLSSESHQLWELPVLFEDEHLLALNKPPGLLSSPDPANPDQPSITQLLHDGIREGKSWARARSLGYLSVAHRLDLDTSGVLLLARSRPMLSALAELFGSEKPLKTFLALIRGQPATETWEVDAPLAPDARMPGVMRVDRAQGKRARTRFALVETYRRYCLVRCQPLTDRPHQIRVHLRSSRLSLVGDTTYRGPRLFLSALKPSYRLKPGREERPLISTPALHLESIDLPHPVTAVNLRIVAPWPKDLAVAVKYLRRYAAHTAATASPAAEDVDDGEANTPGAEV